MKKIKKKTLKKWEACSTGFKRFNELFLKGAYLQEASKALIEDGHPDWANWLWIKCARDNEYVEQTVISAGDWGTATAGDWGTATAGNEGTATAGDKGTATAGDWGTATAGNKGTATAGDEGCISILYYDQKNKKYKRAISEVGGENGLKPDTPYQLNSEGEFVEVVNDTETNDGEV